MFTFASDTCVQIYSTPPPTFLVSISVTIASKNITKSFITHEQSFSESKLKVKPKYNTVVSQF